MSAPAVTGRRSYRNLLAQPAWLLYDGDELVASCRAATPELAREVFKKAGLTGTHMRRGR